MIVDAGEQAARRAELAARRGDLAEARRHHLTAARLGVAESQRLLATLLLEGQGGARDVAGAVGWFQVAAAKGDTLAMLALARLCDQHIPGAAAPRRGETTGGGTPANHGSGQAQPERTSRDPAAADRTGPPFASSGPTTEPDPTRGPNPPPGRPEAIEWYERAGETGDPEAWMRLAFLFHHALPEHRDPERAFIWAYAGARCNFNDAAAATCAAVLAAVETELPPERLATARQRAEALWSRLQAVVNPAGQAP